MPTVWSEDKVNLIKDRWAAGNTASMIAAELGAGITRNAVLGKLLRLGLLNKHTRHEPIKSHYLSFRIDAREYRMLCNIAKAGGRAPLTCAREMLLDVIYDDAAEHLKGAL